MKSKRKNYTETQLSIIDSLYAEFDKANEKLKNIDNDAISLIYQQAKESANAEKNYYDTIEQDNNTILSIRDNLIESLVSKLKVLFEKYPNVQIRKDTTYISIGVIVRYNNKNEPILAREHFTIFTAIGLYTNQLRNHGVSFYFQNDSSKKSISKYHRAYAHIDNKEIDLNDFENSEVFKDRVFKMFNEAMTVHNVL